MVRLLTTSGHGVEVVVGKAGTGKTFVLDAARNAWTPQTSASPASRSQPAPHSNCRMPQAFVSLVFALIDAAVGSVA